METIKIEILNPNALALLKDLAKLDLIKFKKDSKLSFSNVLKKIRAKNNEKLSMEEITAEVDKVRSSRYEE